MSNIDASAPIADIGKQALVEIINRSFSAVDKAVDFAKEQMPDVIYQLLLWKAVWSFFIMVVCISIATASIVFAKKLLAESDDANCLIIPIIFVPISGIALFSAGFDWLQILIAPKIYLLEYAASLAR